MAKFYRLFFILKNLSWLTYILFIYSYLYICMFYGGPFDAFDHENYINFLNNPTPFLFEPFYYLIAIICNLIFTEEFRFPLVFFIFTFFPLLLLITKLKMNKSTNKKR